MLAADRCWLKRSTFGSNISLGTVCYLTREKYCLWAEVVEPTKG